MFKNNQVVVLLLVAMLAVAGILFPSSVQAQAQGANPLDAILTAVTNLNALVTAEFIAVKSQLTTGFSQTDAGLKQANTSLGAISGQVSGLRALSKDRTVLLAPFVTAQGGYDTTFVISNTTLDPFGTSTRSGSCALNYYGSFAPAPQRTPAIPAGQIYADSLSHLAPSFMGYMMAVCDFPGAHGFAFTNPVGKPDNVLPLPMHVVPEPRDLSYAEVLGQ